MEFLVDGWEWILVHDLSGVGVILISVVLAGVIFKWDTKFKKTEK